MKHYCNLCTKDHVHVCSVAKLYKTLWDPMDCILPGSAIHGIFQARILECIAISLSRWSSWPRDRTLGFLRFLHWELGSLPMSHLERDHKVFGKDMHDKVLRKQHYQHPCWDVSCLTAMVLTCDWGKALCSFWFVSLVLWCCLYTSTTMMKLNSLPQPTEESLYFYTFYIKWKVKLIFQNSQYSNDFESY